MKTEKEQSEEIRELIIALSNCQEDTFKYKGSTYSRVSATATTTSTEISLKKTAMNENTQASIFPEGGLRRNEMVMLKAEKQRKSDEWFDTCLERLKNPKISSDEQIHLEYPGICRSERDRGFEKLIDINDSLKSEVRRFQSVIRESVFKGVLTTYVFVFAGKATVYFLYSGHRTINRIKAYSELYKKLKTSLEPVTVKIAS